MSPTIFDPRRTYCNNPNWRLRYDAAQFAYIIEYLHSEWSRDVWKEVYVISREMIDDIKADEFAVQIYTVDGERIDARLKKDFVTDELMLWIPPTNRWNSSGFYPPNRWDHKTINEVQIEGGGLGPIPHDAGVTFKNCTVIGNRVTKHMRWLDEQVEAVCGKARYHE